ncbi:Uncharacterised protein [Candidatus Burarchaeum australiense]|nr:Uncharacterised protein [Candidatus Burarchaeum australiense]
MLPNLFSVYERLLLIRPYTIPSILALGAFAHIFMNNAIIPNLLLLDLISLVGAWGSLIYVVEYSHKLTDGRGHTPIIYPFVFFMIFVLTAIIRQPLTLITYIFMLVATIIYSLKARNAVFGPFLFIFRGLVDVGLFLTIILFYTTNLSWNLLWPISAIYLISVSRNLIGDVRDMRCVEFTFPRKFGAIWSYVVSFVLLAAATITNQHILVNLPLFVILLLILIRIQPYLLHKLFVVSTAAFFINFSADLLSESLILTNILYLSAFFIFTYDCVPRKTNNFWQ